MVPYIAENLMNDESSKNGIEILYILNKYCQ
jgi:hypothetical protein